MAATPQWRRYLRFWRSDIDADVDDELLFHIEMRSREYEAQGLSRDEARRRALERFGPVEPIIAAVRGHDRRRDRADQSRERVREWLLDVRYAVRALRRVPVFTGIAVVTLALGIGANSVMFSLVDAVVLHPVPGIREPDRVFEWVGSTVLAYPDYLDYATADSGVMDLAAFATRQLAVRTGGDPTIRAITLVSGNYFTVLGARARMGRLLAPADDQPGAPAAAVVTDQFWRTQLGSDRHAIGRTVLVSGAPVTIVGVTEPAFRGTRIARVSDVWVPIAAWPLIRPSAFTGLGIYQRGWGWLTAVGRYRLGVTREHAQSVAQAAAQRIREVYPRSAFENGPPTLQPIAATVAGDGTRGLARFMTMLLLVVAAVLLLACANIANLMLARAAHRQPEMAVRAALGATRWRLARQLSVEAIVLGVAAAVVALAAAWVTLGVLRAATLPGQIALGRVGISLNPLVLAFTIGIALATTALFGLAPAVDGAGRGAGDSLRASSRTISTRRGLRDALLVTQVVLSLVLLIGAGLFIRGLQRALTVDLGVRPDHLAMASVNPGLVHYDSVAAGLYVEAAIRRIAALPGVERASWAVSLPVSEHNTLLATIEGYTPTAPAPVPGAPREQVTVNIVSPGYVRTMGGRVVRGREFTDADRFGAPPVALVSESFARHYWPGLDALGRRITIDDTMTVVGVVHDMTVERLDEAPPPLLYQSLAQHPNWMVDNIQVVARTTGDPQRMLSLLTRSLLDVGPDVPVFGAATFGDAIDDAVAPQRLGAALLAAFSLLALAVAAAGIYGVVAFLVSQRTREIGIRLALGARPSRVIALVVGQNLRRVAIGIGIGLVVAAAATRVIGSFLFGVSPTDLATYAITALVLAAAGTIAAYLPARRVMAVDPVESLRAE